MASSSTHHIFRFRYPRPALSLIAVVSAFACAALAGVPTAWAQQPAVPETVAPQSGADRGLVSEPRIIGRAIELSQRWAGTTDGGAEKNGFYPEFGDLVTGAGWISAGPGYRHWFGGDALVVDASAAVSWRSYKMAQARVEAPSLARGRMTVGSLVRWQDYTQITFFGVGPESREEDRSEYGLRAYETTGYAIYRPQRWLAVEGRLGWLGRPELRGPSGTFERGNPDAHLVFPDDPALSLTEQPAYLHGTAAVVADTRDHRGYATEGGLYRAAVSRYADRDAGTFSFTRYEGEAAQFAPLARGRLVLAGHAWLVGTQVADGHAVPLYLSPSLGGANTLRGYTDYRFHDRALLLLSAEARVPLMRHLDLAGFVDAGNVAPRVGDLDVARRSYGTGLRLHTDRTTLVRLDLAHGEEGWRVVFRTTDALKLARVTRRSATVPFAP